MSASLLGSTVRSLRRNKGLSQEVLAERAKLKTLTLRHIETGRRKPTFQTLNKIATALGEPIETFARLLPPQGEVGGATPSAQIHKGTDATGLAAMGDRAGPHHADTAWSPAVTAGLAQWLTKIDLMMDRRTLIHATTAAITGLLEPPGGWLGSSPAAAIEASSRSFAGRIGRQDITELERAAEIFHRWYHCRGGGLRREAVVGQLNGVAILLDEHQGTAVEQDLFRI